MPKREGKEKESEVLVVLLRPLPFKQIIRDLHTRAHTHTHTDSLAALLLFVCKQMHWGPI